MSRRSKRSHRQEKGGAHQPSLGHLAATPQNTPGARKGRVFAAELRINQSGKDFEIVVKTVSPLSNSVQEQTFEVSFKSNHPKSPVIKVPGLQPQRPNTSAAPQGTPAVSASLSK